MASQAAQLKTDNNESPLDRLSTLMHNDMLKVNELILDNMQSEVPLIPQLAGYLIASGGKRIRPLLTLASTALLEGDMRSAHKLATAVEFIHTATLLHDDVVDGSEERRGKDAANLVFGNQASVLVGDFLFSRAFQLMVSSRSLEVLRILSDASAIITQGEVKQLTITGNIKTSMDDYIEVVSAKTAALFAAACEVGAVISEEDKELQKAMHSYGLYLGIAFQIIDDVLDYNADQKKLGKSIGDDFREGKITAPILIALKEANSEELSFWQRVLSEKNQKESDLNKAIEILQAHNALSKGAELANHYAKKAQDCLPVKKQNEISALLSQLASYTVQREF